jgi:hypothetical protein
VLFFTHSPFLFLRSSFSIGAVSAHKPARLHPEPHLPAVLPGPAQGLHPPESRGRGAGQAHSGQLQTVGVKKPFQFRSVLFTVYFHYGLSCVFLVSLFSGPILGCFAVGWVYRPFAVRPFAVPSLEECPPLGDSLTVKFPPCRHLRPPPPPRYATCCALSRV